MENEMIDIVIGVLAAIAATAYGIRSSSVLKTEAAIRQYPSLTRGEKLVVRSVLSAVVAVGSLAHALHLIGH